MKFLHFRDWDTLAYWITAIATGLLVFFAYKAIHSWRDELKLKRKAELAENLLMKLDELYTFLAFNEIYGKNYNDKDRYNIIKKIVTEIELIFGKYRWLFKTNTKNIDYFRNLLKNLLTNFISVDFIEFASKYFKEGSIEYKEFNKNLKEIKEFCYKDIRKLYI